MSQKFKSAILTFLIAVAIIGSAFIWYRFLASEPSQPVAKMAASADVSNRSLLTLLESLEGLKFDFEFIAGPIYRSFQDFTPNIAEPAEKGRPNPFAPLEKQ
ncbi:MAG: hypothetical protein AAB474_02095 [Patescibacteria group bacterium]